MPSDTLAILSLLFFVIGALYACVGHAGASGYLAVMALLSIPTEVMRPTALAINVLVAVIAFAQFARAGHFSWRLFWPFGAGSVPAAFFGGRVQIAPGGLRIAIGVLLMLAAMRMVMAAAHPQHPGTKPSPPSVPVAAGVGAALGFVAGLTGTGGGILLSPLLLLLNWADTKRTAATAALFILLNSLAGLTGLASSGWKPTSWLAALAAAACVGGLIGSWIGSRRATPRGLNMALALVLVIAGGKLVIWQAG